MNALHPVQKSNISPLEYRQLNEINSVMFAKIKSSNFIDALQLELIPYNKSSSKGILKDDKGSVCAIMERKIPDNQNQVYWLGLNDLPYGQYTLELLQAEEEMKMNLVKRV